MGIGINKEFIKQKDSKNIYNANYKLPPLSLLKNPKAGNNKALNINCIAVYYVIYKSYILYVI